MFYVFDTNIQDRTDRQGNLTGRVCLFLPNMKNLNLIQISYIYIHAMYISGV